LESYLAEEEVKKKLKDAKATKPSWNFSILAYNNSSLITWTLYISIMIISPFFISL
jgi:hypothetical protein